MSADWRWEYDPDRMSAADGWFYFLAAPRARLIVVVRIIPPFDAL
ncbi:hypothetical protein [Streptomyces sp. NRRL S-244]|nr:hypothetical protein [Streptomyces sp. NRRL S-244]